MGSNDSVLTGESALVTGSEYETMVGEICLMGFDREQVRPSMYSGVAFHKVLRRVENSIGMFPVVLGELLYFK